MSNLEYYTERNFVVYTGHLVHSVQLGRKLHNTENEPIVFLVVSPYLVDMKNVILGSR